MDDRPYFEGDSQTLINGDKLVYGQQGTVVGPGEPFDNDEDYLPTVAVLFLNNKNAIIVLHREKPS